MDEGLHEMGRPANWNETSAAIASTGFVASAGPSLYTDEENKEWDYYTIDIEYSYHDISYVFFARNFEIEEIASELLLADVETLFTYDEKSRTVTFEIGEITERYILPEN